MVVQESVNALLALPEPLARAEPVDALQWVTVLAPTPGRLDHLRRVGVATGARFRG